MTQHEGHYSCMHDGGLRVLVKVLRGLWTASAGVVCKELLVETSQLPFRWS